VEGGALEKPYCIGEVLQNPSLCAYRWYTSEHTPIHTGLYLDIGACPDTWLYPYIGAYPDIGVFPKAGLVSDIGAHPGCRVIDSGCFDVGPLIFVGLPLICGHPMHANIMLHVLQRLSWRAFCIH
jgi:hypothetical protein